MAKQGKHGDLVKQLRKSFKNIAIIRDLWTTNCKSSISSLKSMVNVAEQYHCVLRVTGGSQPKSSLVESFPDIPGRIRHKLVTEMELILKKLFNDLAEMENIHSQVHRQYLNAMTAYKRSSHNLPVQEVVTGTSTWPSTASMLEWLLDIDCIFKYLYENQVQVLDTVDYSNEELMQSLQIKWTRGNNEAQESIENVLAHVSFFMADG